jgi:hypothetical protein
VFAPEVGTGQPRAILCHWNNYARGRILFFCLLYIHSVKETLPEIATEGNFVPVEAVLRFVVGRRFSFRKFYNQKSPRLIWDEEIMESNW